MRIVHIASFQGNVGDIINHEGFCKGMCREVCDDILYKRIEIRKFYRNTRLFHFNRELADEINKHDMLVLGGGGFFDVRWNASATGTTLDMPLQFIERVQIPVLINAMGFHAGDRNQCGSAFEKFYNFLEQLNRLSNWKVTLRNDGSCKRLSDIYGKKLLKNIESVPDNGFFFNGKNLVNREVEKSETIGINITNDLFEERYTNNVSEMDFNQSITKFIKQLLHKGYRLMFFLHTPQDIKVLQKIFDSMEDIYLREQIVIAPYQPIDCEGAIQLENYYKQCKLIIAMRFHANILAMQNYIPVIGLCGHAQIEDLYEEIGMVDQCIRVGEDTYIENLAFKTEKLLQSPESHIERMDGIMRALEESHSKYMQKIKSFVRSSYNEN